MNLKKQKGAVTLFVLVSCLFFLASVACVNIYVQSKQVAVDREYRQIKANYEKDINNMDSIYEELSSKNNLTVNFGIPEIDASVKKILVEVSTNLENIHVDTIKYRWVHSNEEKEITELTAQLENLEQLTNSEINITNWTYVEKQDNQNKFNTVLNYEDNKGYYYLCVNIDNKEYWTQVNRYTKEGLVLHLDGINYNGVGDYDKSERTTSTIWTNLAGETLNGTLNNFNNNTSSVWEEDHLNFDGEDDWVSIGQIHYPKITIEAVVENTKIKSLTETTYVGNWHSSKGGYGLLYNSANTPLIKKKNQFRTYANDKQIVDTGKEIEVNKKYILTGSYDGNIIKFWENGEKTQIQGNGNIKTTENNTITALGTDAVGSNAGITFFEGKIYAVRIYNRALSEEEIKQNFETDKLRFGITE